MNKMKFILPLTGLATVPAIVMPLTSCNKNSSYSLTIEGQQITQYQTKPYDQQYTASTVRIQDAMNNYINAFGNINEAFASDVAYSALNYKTPTNDLEVSKVEVLNCSFDKKEWQLSNNLKITYADNTITEIKVSKLRYSVNPYAEPQGTNLGVYFSPIGVAGVILQDKSWSIEYKLNNQSTFTKISYETELKDWEDFWKEAQSYICFIPYYYKNCLIAK